MLPSNIDDLPDEPLYLEEIVALGGTDAEIEVRIAARIKIAGPIMEESFTPAQLLKLIRKANEKRQLPFD